MTLRDAPRIPTFAAAGLALAALAAPAAADDPPLAEGRSAQVEAPATGDLPRGDAVLDAMPLFTGAIGDAAGSGEGVLETPALGDRPTPAEARRRGEVGETRMRPRGGSATGGKPDVPPER
ncbi:hypothetical protein [Salinarimonas rosea]|uniref:hypothetical protein n=1 Tax=Salinarimonas rosea TaxID=552063 RepID=UPI00048E760E|nr:hypothetical protein [Salinarimonas rosea]